LLLLDHGVVIDYVSEAVFRDAGVADGDSCFGIEEANKFVDFGSFPQKAIWTILSRAIGERLAVNIHIESRWYTGVGDGKHGCIGSTVCTIVVEDALGGGSASPTAEVVLMDRLWRDRVRGPQDSAL
jgi:hypothetical protein